MMWSRCVAPSWWFYPEQCQAGHPWRNRQGHRVLVALRLRGRAGRPAARPRPPDGAVRGAGLHGLRLILNGDELKIGSPALARWPAGARCRARRWRRAVSPARKSARALIVATYADRRWPAPGPAIADPGALRSGG